MYNISNYVNILGTKYRIRIKNYHDDPIFNDSKIAGFCNDRTKEIVLVDIKTFPTYENETDESIKLSMMSTLRHEIVHAFLSESGLASSASSTDGSWADCEEIVDWFAIQGPKLFSAWKACGALS